jgi:hypothetical protein
VGELGHRAHEAELVQRGRPQVAHDALDLLDGRVHLVGQAPEQGAVACRPRRPG